jgi:protein phosphatase
MPSLSRIEAAAQTHVGLRRQRNEDSFAALPDLGLFLVADGLGGGAAGDIASQLAVITVTSFFQQADADATWPHGVDPSRDHDEVRLILGVWRANRRILEAARDNPACDGMATTLSGLLVSKEGAYLAHVGDSRIYRFREGQLERMTRDHTMLGDYVEKHGPLPSHLAGIGGQHLLTRALGADKKVRVDTRVERPQAGDLMLLCSDGLTGVVTDDEIAAILREPTDLSTAAERLIERANEGGGPDNVTVVLVRWRW